MNLAAAVHLGIQPDRQSVDDTRAHTMQTAGRGIGAATEFAAGVQLGHHQFEAGQPALLLGVDRDTAAVVLYLDRVILVQDHGDLGAVSGQGLVDGVIDDFPHAVHEPARVS